jgi:hypothetical protein
MEDTTIVTRVNMMMILRDSRIMTMLFEPRLIKGLTIKVPIPGIMNSRY